MKRIVFHGRVQGVGFRWTTRGVAANFAVTGFVRNQSDGTVELVVDGSNETIQQFVEAIEAALPGHVTHRDEEPFATSETFDTFAIRR